MLGSYQLNICNSNLLLESGHSIPRRKKGDVLFLCSTEGRVPLHINSEKWNFLDCSGSGACPI